MDSKLKKGTDSAQNSELGQYRYFLSSISKLASGEVCFTFTDKLVDEELKISLSQIKEYKDILNNCHPFNVFDIGFMCGIQSTYLPVLLS
ncbi:hypothetical protein JQC92_16165 [Shewanella sp. 202IG2-18]|uniref:hypothetical protein n=1 Tax=Parashewanella hymeniacidonis TaxID=2807618 RepID=UPI001961BFB3|nr:hypothetical protein [Parashewanella hymeniacidonis]MBM7073550.1 hypothetical protein [Parashewanella hymeniacidonis]